MSRKIYFRGLSREDNEAFAAGLTSGGWVEVPAYSVTELCKKSEGIAHVSEEDKAALNPSYNSRYNMLKNSLRSGGSADNIIPMLGIHAIRIARSEETYLQLNQFGVDAFTELYTRVIKNDVGNNDAYCVLVYKGRDDEEHLLAVYYDQVFLVPVAGITGALAREINVPWLRPTETGIRWENPMPYLTDDQKVRLYSMIKSMYPIKSNPGIASFLNQYAELADSIDEALIRSYVKVRESEDVVEYIGNDNLSRMTVPGYTEQGDLPRVFNDKLAVIQGDIAPYKGVVIDYTDIGGTKTRLAIVPPLNRAILDSDFNVADIEYLPRIGEDKQFEYIEVTAKIQVGSETVTRRARYGAGDMIDITGLDNVIQMNHMYGVSNKDWKGRLLIRTGMGSVSEQNVTMIDGIKRAKIDRYLPNGSDKVRKYEISSENAAWHLYKTGITTEYLTLVSAKGGEIANLLTNPAVLGHTGTKVDGQGIISFDGGATSIVCHTRLDHNHGYAPLEIKAEEIAQPITPMNADVFKLITGTITLPDVEGAIHPTAVEKFFVADKDSESDLRFPGAFMRLLSFNDEQLAKMMEIRSETGRFELRRSSSVIMNMKDAEYSGGKNDRRDAYVTAVATFIELAVLHMLSNGQKDIKILFAYPKGVRNGLAVIEAKDMLEEFIGSDVTIDVEAYAESTASATYVRKHGNGEIVVARKSPLLTIDIGGYTTDISLYYKGKEIFSSSYSYASIISQLSAGLMLLRGEDRKKHVRSIFGVEEMEGKLAESLIANMKDITGKGGMQVNEAVYATENRKLLEQMYRKDNWKLSGVGSFIKNFHKLWMLPIVDMICLAIKDSGLDNIVVAFTGAGSLFAEKLFKADSECFKQRIISQVFKETGISIEIMFAASKDKQEVAVGMINAFDDGIRGVSAGEISADKSYLENLLNEALERSDDDEELAEDIRNALGRCSSREKPKMSEVRDLADQAVVGKVTRKSYNAFVEGLIADGMIDSEYDDYCGFTSVYDTLTYEPGGFDNFDAIVENTAERFSGISGNGKMSERLLHYLVAFEIANREMARAQCAGKAN